MRGGLHTVELGERGPRVVFCHGLFGQGKNFTAVGTALAERHRVTLVDLPDHGRSPRTERFDYLGYAEAVAGLLSEQDPVALVGHSMGGKVAMVLALHHPRLVERLVVVDVAPVAYRHAAEFERYIAAMRAVDVSTLGSRGEADARLADAVPDPGVRGFLLQSLRRDAGPDGQPAWHWLLNLELLGRDLDAITGWPDQAGATPFDGPVLWVAGAESRYVAPEHVEAMDALFPRNRRVTVKGAGHWVHAEQPEVFLEVVRRFVDQ